MLAVAIATELTIRDFEQMHKLMTEMKVGAADSRTPLHLLLRKRDFIDNTKGKTTVRNHERTQITALRNEQAGYPQTQKANDCESNKCE
jgi:hypothetical protein